jgi:hypothetical protein
MHSWPYYCQHCEHLTNTQAALEAAMAAKPEAAIGIVAAWPVQLNIEYPRLEEGQKEGRQSRPLPTQWQKEQRQ